MIGCKKPKVGQNFPVISLCFLTSKSTRFPVPRKKKVWREFPLYKTQRGILHVNLICEECMGIIEKTSFHQNLVKALWFQGVLKGTRENLRRAVKLWRVQIRLKEWKISYEDSFKGHWVHCKKKSTRTSDFRWWTLTFGVWTPDSFCSIWGLYGIVLGHHLLVFKLHFF